jgi:signal transduction histidine kinase
MLGSKGIGRFAASRLGRFTTLETVHRSDQHQSMITSLDIDWEWFDSAHYLDQIDIPVATKKLSRDAHKKTGLRLFIRDLRDTWTKKRLEALIRELRRLVSPSETAATGFEIRLDLIAFTVQEHGFSGQELLTGLNFATFTTTTDTDPDPFLIRPFGLQQHADYILKGTFDEQGSFSGTFTIWRGDGAEQHLSLDAPVLSPEETSCGLFSFQINIYDRERDAIEALFARMGANFEKIGMLAARRILTENAGIAIFRNGFRIRPYGEPDNDWLELERQRVQDPSKTLGLSQVSGTVDILDEDASKLVERSSREGLEHNGAFERMKRLLQAVMLHAEERRFDFREKAGLSCRAIPNMQRVREAASLRHVTWIAESLPAEYRTTIEAAIQKDAAELSAGINEMDEYQQLLQSRAALGLVLAEVLHEGRRILNPVASSAKTLIDGHTWVLEQSKRGEVFRKQFPGHASTIYEGVQDLGRLFKKLDPVSGRKRGRPGPFTVGKVINRSLELFNDVITAAGIQVSIQCTNALVAYGYESDLQAALMNVIDNAIYRLGTSAQERHLNMSCTSDGRTILVTLCNNGPLLDDAYIPRLFDAGFTLKSGGTGLGLTIAREALRASKGEIAFDDNAAETTFVIRLPAAPRPN